MIVINLFGGPCTGKSVLALELTSVLRKQGINAELVTEPAKDICWDESYKLLDNQLLLFALSEHKIQRLKHKVDIVVCDYSILYSKVYGKDLSPAFKELIDSKYRSYDNINVLLKRSFPYEGIGRAHTEEEAKEVDRKMYLALGQEPVDFVAPPSAELIEGIVNLAKKRLHELVS